MNHPGLSLALLAAWLLAMPPSECPCPAGLAAPAVRSDPLSAPDQFTPTNRVFDADACGIPRFVETDYIESSKIDSISTFRSAVGHDYSDDFESCRSMKHYFKPRDQVDWSAVKVCSPVAGVVFRTEDEWAGARVEIEAAQCPAFGFVLFHVKLLKPLRAGDKVAAGQWLGFHVGRQTYSDLAVSIRTPKGRMLVSYFTVMSDALFDTYRQRGLASRADAIISKKSRDADPLTCRQGNFTSRGQRQNWINMGGVP